MAYSKVTPLEEKYPALSRQMIEDLGAMDATEQQYRKQDDKAKEVAKCNTEAYVSLQHHDLTVKASNEINIVLLGKTGAGKSSTGNLILGKNSFRTSAAHQSCTQTIQIEECWFDDVKLCVVDTPGFFDSSVPPEAIATELLKIGTNCDEGIHAFVFVRSLGNVRTTPEEQQAFKNVEEMFGEDAMNHCIFLFTRANEIIHMPDLRDKTIVGYLEQAAGESKMYSSVGNRVIGVENIHTTPYEKQLQRKRLIAYVQCLVDRAESKTYTHEVFEAAKKRRDAKIKDGLDKKIGQIVSKELENKTPAELQKMARGRHKKVVQTIRTRHDYMPPEIVIIHIESLAEIYTDKSFIGHLKDIAVSIFAAAGCLVKKLLLF